MVLTAEQRRAQDEEMALKRQKKEEERQRVAQQFAEDRVDRAEKHDFAGTGLAEQVATPAAVAAAPKRVESTSVRLQIRATQHWNRVVVFTCFTPDSTLSEVAHALWEDLGKGVVDAGGGADAEAVGARMAGEDAIKFVETVPPRRRWASQDMQQTLRSAGLCPSSTLLAEVPPIEPLEAAAPTAAPSSEMEDGESSSEPRAAEDDAKGGKGGAGRLVVNWTGKGGSAKGAAGMGAEFTGGSPTTPDDDDADDDDASDDADDSDDPMMAGKGKPALAGRLAPGGKGKGPQGHQFPESGGQALGSTGAVGAAGGAALAQYSTVVAAPSAEQQEAARDARLAALQRRGLAPSAAAPKAGGLARSNEEPKGRMGDGQTKADRASEREAILARLQEDKEDQLIRRPLSHAAASTPAAQAATTGVRLQVRCPVSKRIHIAVGFAEGSLLGELLVSSSAELDIQEAVLTLGYPPWTEFTGDDSKKTLKELGLCPSATLLIKSGVVEAPGDDDSAPVAQAAAAE